MKKLNKSLILMILLFNFISLSSCIETSDVNKSKLPYEVTFTKNIYADSFDELETIIMNTNSYCDADLKFYYNLGFLEKYNWTMSPDYSNADEFVYPIVDNKILHSQFHYLGSVRHSILYGMYFYANREEEHLNTPDRYSTSVDFLNEIGTNSYYYKYDERNYKTGSYETRIFNEITNKFSYGITYQARSIEPIFLTKTNQTFNEFRDKVESPNVQICPNLMIPSLEDVEPNENGFYTVPVVIKEEYENITLVCRIYMDSYPIDCVIRFKYSSKLNSIEKVKEFINSIDIKDYIESYYSPSKSNFGNAIEYYNLKFNYEYDDGGYVTCFKYSIDFFAVHNKDKSNIKLNKPYLLNYIEKLDDYFYSFADGIKEINIKYRSKN